MLSVFEAQKIVDEKLPHWKVGTKPVLADRDYPPIHRVMMDGIAIKFSDYEEGKRSFVIEGICAAGTPENELRSGCLEVMTGSPLPKGADLVIPYEHLKIEKGLASIVVDSKRAPFDSVHLKGSDCRKGDQVLSAGLLWNGPRIGIIASMGTTFEDQSPKIMIISTGDELVEKNPLPHQSRRSNVYALKASLELHGYTQVELDHLSDDPQIVADHFKKHVDHFDVLIYSGGVSKGKFDYLPHVWSDLGVTKYFHEVAQRPGKPLWFGAHEEKKTIILGLPGNPVSSLVCLHRYFIKSKPLSVKLTEDVFFNKELTYFVPAKLNVIEAELRGTPLKIKNSGEFTALAESDGFIELPADKSQFKLGEVYPFYSWRPFSC